MAVLEQERALDPESATIPGRLGSAWLAVGLLDRAIAELRRHTALDPKAAASWANLCFALEEADRLAEAEAACRQAVALSPSDRRYAIPLARLLLDSGRPQEVEALLQPVIDLAPTDQSALVTRARGWLALGQGPRAMEGLRALVRKAPAARNDAAYALAQAGAELQQASSWAEEAVATQEAKVRAGPAVPSLAQAAETRSLASYWDTLGWVRFRQERFGEAVRLLAAAAELDSSATVHGHLGRALQAAGSPDAAAKAYARALVLLGPPAGTRPRLRELVGEQAMPALLAEARADLARKQAFTGALLANAPPATPATSVREVLLGFSDAGVLVEIHDGAGTRPPQLAPLIGQRLLVELPPGAPSPLVLRARALCSPDGCALERRDGKLAREEPGRKVL